MTRNRKLNQNGLNLKKHTYDATHNKTIKSCI